MDIQQHQRQNSQQIVGKIRVDEHKQESCELNSTICDPTEEDVQNMDAIGISMMIKIESRKDQEEACWEIRE